MGSVSKYVNDKTIISNLRGFYDAEEQYRINFRYWLHTAKQVKDGIMIQVGSRRFLVDAFTGSVIREVR